MAAEGPYAVSPDDARRALENIPPGTPASGPRWAVAIRLIAAAPDGETRRAWAEIAAERFAGVTQAQVVDAAAASAAQPDPAPVPLEERIAAVTEQTPDEHLRGLCAELAALDELKRQPLIKLLAQKSGRGVRAVRQAVADALRQLLRDASAAQAAAGQAPGTRVRDRFPEFPGPADFTVPARYSVGDDGRVMLDGRFGPEEVSPELIVPVARLIDIDTARVKLECAVLKFPRLPDGRPDLAHGRWVRIVADRATWLDAKRIIALADEDSPVDSRHAKAASEFIAALEHSNLGILPEIFVAGSLGWREHAGHRVFVLPDRVLGLQDGDAPLRAEAPDAGDRQALAAIAQGGTWEGWCDLFRLVAEQAPVGRLAVYAALASPLLPVVGQQGGLLHLCGATSSGKTTLLQVAASAAGRPGGPGLGAAAGLVVDWAGTFVSKERRFALMRHVPAFVDDNQNARPDDVVGIAYLLANGTGRSRGSIRGLQRVATWQLMGVSTGEKTMGELSRMGGLRVRCIDLWLSRPPFPDAAACQRARALAGEHFGHALPRFLDRLLAHDPLELQERHRAAIGRLLQAVGPLPDAAGEMVARLAGLWAAMLVAAEILHSEVEGVPPAAPDDLLDYVAGWFRETVRGEAPQHSHVAAYRDLMAEAVAHPSAMFGSPVAGDKEPPGGWLGKDRVDVGGVPCTAFIAPLAKTLLAKYGYPVDATLRAWRDDGVLFGSKQELTRLVAFEEGRRTRCIVLRQGGYDQAAGAGGDPQSDPDTVIEPAQKEEDRF